LDIHLVNYVTVLLNYPVFMNEIYEVLNGRSEL